MIRYPQGGCDTLSATTSIGRWEGGAAGRAGKGVDRCAGAPSASAPRPGAAALSVKRASPTKRLQSPPVSLLLIPHRIAQRPPPPASPRLRCSARRPPPPRAASARACRRRRGVVAARLVLRAAVGAAHGSNLLHAVHRLRAQLSQAIYFKRIALKHVRCPAVCGARASSLKHSPARELARGRGGVCRTVRGQPRAEREALEGRLRVRPSRGSRRAGPPALPARGARGSECTVGPRVGATVGRGGGGAQA